MPLTSKVAAVWVDIMANSSIVFSSKGRMSLYMASTHIMHATTHYYVHFSFQRVSSGGTIAFQKWV